jgi:hypothetical protein
MIGGGGVYILDTSPLPSVAFIMYSLYQSMERLTLFLLSLFKWRFIGVCLWCSNRFIVGFLLSHIHNMECLRCILLNSIRTNIYRQVYGWTRAFALISFVFHWTQQSFSVKNFAFTFDDVSLFIQWFIFQVMKVNQGQLKIETILD